MKLETKKTLYLTKEEKKVLSNFYWNFYEDDDTDNMYEVLKTLSGDYPMYISSYEIKITD